MAITQTTRMNLTLDIMTALKPLEGRIYHNARINESLRIDQIDSHYSARVTWVTYHRKGDMVSSHSALITNFHENYRPATLAQAKAFTEALKRAKEGQLAQKSKEKVIVNGLGVPITGPMAEKRRYLFPQNP